VSSAAYQVGKSEGGNGNQQACLRGDESFGNATCDEIHLAADLSAQSIKGEQHAVDRAE